MPTHNWSLQAAVIMPPIPLFFHLKLSLSLSLPTNSHPFLSSKDQLKLYMLWKPKWPRPYLYHSVYIVYETALSHSSHASVYCFALFSGFFMYVISFQIGFKFIVQRCICIFYFSLPLWPNCIIHSNLVICHCHM